MDVEQIESLITDKTSAIIRSMCGNICDVERRTPLPKAWAEGDLRCRPLPLGSSIRERAWLRVWDASIFSFMHQLTNTIEEARCPAEMDGPQAERLKELRDCGPGPCGLGGRQSR